MLGSKANKNDGIPIVTTPIKLKCTGSKGNSWLKNRNNNAKVEEYMVFTKNNEAERSILFIVRLPSATTFGIEAKLESNNIN